MEERRTPQLEGVLRQGHQIARQQELGGRSAEVSENLVAMTVGFWRRLRLNGNGKESKTE